MDDLIQKFTNHLKTVLTRALVFAVEFEQQTIEPTHLLWALSAQKGSIATDLLQRSGVDEQALRAHLPLDRTAPICDGFVPSLSEESKIIIEKAVAIAHSYRHHYVGTEHLLAGILEVKNERIATTFELLNVNASAMRGKLGMLFKATSSFPLITESALAEAASDTTAFDATLMNTDLEEESKTPALDFFTEELTGSDTVDALDPVIGREEEIERVVEILSRRTKNNPILIGEPGVGKTAIVEGLAKRIVEGKVPSVLEGKKIHRLDIASLVAGTMYRGEFEQRLRSLMDEIADNDDVILFIDEVHTIIGAGSASGSLDAANMLKPALARGEIRCIGATTPMEYKKFIENDGALERRFQRVTVKEPSVADTKKILHGIKRAFEDFHEVTISEEAINVAVLLSEKHLPHERFPDKAIDLIDEASSSVNAKGSDLDAQTKKRAHLRKQMTEMRKAKIAAVSKEDFTQAKILKEKEAALAETLKKLENERDSKKRPIIKRADIERAVAKRAHIPLSHIAPQEAPHASLKKALQKRILGQDHAIDTVCHALLKSQLQLQNPQKPLASFLFLGPTGSGKTALAEALAEQLFETREPFLRVDMSEYKESHGIAKLVGSPAGYIGYKDRNILLDHIKAHPHSVILFDEIEKAHPDVLHLFLQLLDSGTVTDASGAKGNFRNAIIIFTSNAGADELLKKPFGFSIEENQKNTKTPAILRELFSKEFLSRIEHTCLFHALEEKTLAKIAKQEIAKRIEHLETLGITLKVESMVAQTIAKQITVHDGARHIHRLISEHIEHPLVHAVATAPKRKTFTVSAKNGNIVLHPQK